MTTAIPLEFYPVLSPSIEDQLFFLNRLGNLQWLCSDTIEEDNNSPQSLLFISGVDGKNNKLSNQILLHLFPLLNQINSITSFNYLEYNNNNKLSDFLLKKKKKNRIFYNKKENKKYLNDMDEEMEKIEQEREEEEEELYKEIFDKSENELNKIIHQNILNELEETVLLIKEHSISFLFTEKIQRLLSNYLKQIKSFYINEFIIKDQEVIDLDLFQYKKIFYFKQLMLINENNVITASNQKNTIGIPLNPGYYSPQEEIERYPLIQAFALDHIFTSTGFFTLRYSIVDINSIISDVIFKQIDGKNIEEYQQDLERDTLKYYNNILKILHVNNEKRSKLTGEELVEPLELYYEFNLLNNDEDEEFSSFKDKEVEEEESKESSSLIKFNIRNVFKPWVLIGKDTQLIVSKQNELEYHRGKWRKTSIENSPLCIIESNVKMNRFCRTIFFLHGVSSSILTREKKLKESLAGLENKKLIEEILANNSYNQQLFTSLTSATSTSIPSSSVPKVKSFDIEEDDDYLYEMSQISSSYNLSAKSIEKELKVLKNFHRYYKLYLKLWYCLRVVSFKTLMENFDVLNAANQIKATLNSAMSSSNLSSTFSSSEKDDLFHLDLDHTVKLEGQEKLSLHIDCMNNSGDIISIDEIDELGGSCYVYIRASIYNLEMEYLPDFSSSFEGPDNFLGTISIGDTFLFTPLTTFNRYPIETSSISPHINDSVCLTSSIPYVTLLNNNNLELSYSELLSRCLKNPTARNILGLQENISAPTSSSSILTSNPFTSASSNSNSNGILSKLSVSLLTNTFEFPHLHGEISCYSSGFLMNFQSGNFLTNHSGCLTLPLCVSFLYDIESFAVLNTLDYYEQIVTDIEGKNKKNLSMNFSQFLKDLYQVETLYPAIPEGIVILMNLREESTCLDHLLHLPTSSKIIPSKVICSNGSCSISSPKDSISRPRTIAICLDSNDLYMNSFNLIIDMWRTSLRRKNIVEIKSIKEYNSYLRRKEEIEHLISRDPFDYFKNLYSSFLIYMNDKILIEFNDKLSKKINSKNNYSSISFNIFGYYQQQQKGEEEKKEDLSKKNNEIIENSSNILTKISILNELFGNSDGNSYHFIACLHDNFSYFFGLPGCGRLMLSINHSISELKRLSSFDFQSLIFSNDQTSPTTSSPTGAIISPNIFNYEKKLLNLYTTSSTHSFHFLNALLIYGYSGSGIETVGTKLYEQLTEIFSAKGYEIEYVPMNFSKIIDYSSSSKENQINLQDYINSTLNSINKLKKNSLLIFHITLCYQYNIPIQDLKLLISTITHSRILQSTAVVTPENLYHYDTYNKDDLLKKNNKKSDYDSDHDFESQRYGRKGKNEKEEKKFFNENSIENNEAFRSKIILKGLGYSFIQALNRELISYDNSDSILCVTHYFSSSSSISTTTSTSLTLTQKSNQFHEEAYLYLVDSCSNNLTEYTNNNKVKIIKANPTSKKVLDDDEIDYYLKRFQIVTSKSLSLLPLTRNETLTTLLGYPSPLFYDSLGNHILSQDYKFIPFPKFSVQNLQTKCMTLSELMLKKSYQDDEKVSCWSLNNLLLLLYQLFPLAKKSFHQNISKISFDKKKAIKSDKYSPFIMNMLTKTFFNLHMKELEENFLIHFNEFANTPASTSNSSSLYDLQLGIINIYAEIIVKNESISYSSASSLISTFDSPYKIIVIEANRGYISLKEKEYKKGNFTYPNSSSTSTPSGYLLVDGILTEKNWKSLDELFNLCARNHMRQRELLTVDNYLELISLDTKEKMVQYHIKKTKFNQNFNEEKKNSFVKSFQLSKVSSTTLEALLSLQSRSPYITWSLPLNIWYDGSFYIDISGNRTKLRPDILDIVEDYLEKVLNVKAKEYNEIIQLLNF